MARLLTRSGILAPGVPGIAGGTLTVAGNLTFGSKAVYLDTVPAAMPSAHRLYLDMGFIPCAPYNDNPVDDLAYLVKYL